MKNFIDGEIKETCVNFIDKDNMASVQVFQAKYINQIKALAEKYPDRVKMIETNQKGVVLAHLPKEFVHISIGERSKREMTEDQRAAAAERLRNAREKKAGLNEG